MKSFNSNSTVSVIIPVLNGEDTLGELFASLANQTLRPLEIVVGDSSSDDDSVEICKINGARVISYPRLSFDHGSSRTMLAKEARGEIVVFLTQDVVLANRDSLAILVNSLLQDEKTACGYGRQLPHKNATFIAAHLRKFNYPSISYTRSFADRYRYGLKTIFISNSFAAYKKKELMQVGFFQNGLIFGEDTCTLGKLLQAGCRVAYVSKAAVYHSHNYSFAAEFRRSFDIGVLHSSEKWLLDVYGGAEKIGNLYIRSAVQDIFQEKKYWLLSDLIGRSLSKYAGYRLGRSFKKIPAGLRPRLSMNCRWWKKGG